MGSRVEADACTLRAVRIISYTLDANLPPNLPCNLNPFLVCRQVGF